MTAPSLFGGTLRGHWEVPGLPDRWPEMIAHAFSELSPDEFDRAWEDLGEAVLLRSRAIRREIEALEDGAS